MVEAIGNFVVVELILRADTEKAALAKSLPGFEIRIKEQGQPQMGIVRSIGADVKDHLYEIGEKVLFAKKDVFQGFRIDNIDYVGLEANEIIATIGD